MENLWKNRNIVILGLSRTGEAAAKYLHQKEAHCVISEKRVATAEDKEKISELESAGIKVETGENREETIMNADLVVTSPGIPPKAPVIQLIREKEIELISEPELAYREANIPIIAVTGTNGKSTTTTLISEIFKNAGYKAPVCGNIGYPIVNEIDKGNDYLIAEISSFQLEYSPTFKPKVAVFMNYTADHVDWHGSEEEYLRVKTQFVKGKRSPEWVVFNACDKILMRVAEENQSTRYWFGKEMGEYCCFMKEQTFFIKEKDNIMSVLNQADVKLFGNHNYQNIMASIAAARIAGISVDVIARTVKEFQGIEHRLEYITDINGIAFYNDSKATNCDSTICALKAFEDTKIVLIAGGRDKGTDLTELVQEIKNHTTNVILIGEATERFAGALKEGNYENIHKVNSLEAAIEKGLELNDGPVVLSPACASYDMFSNFEERGRVFKDIVKRKKK
jgi:UDP-N-acetylmuramoylalanine--D-glutamate ligase